MKRILWILVLISILQGLVFAFANNHMGEIRSLLFAIFWLIFARTEPNK